MGEVVRLSCASVLQTACELMAETGYTAMSMRQLASRLGILPGSLYHHVACKQDLLLSVLLDIVEQRMTAWEREPRGHDLQGFIGFMLKRQSSHPQEDLLLRHEVRHLDDRSRRCLDEALGRLHKPLISIIQRDCPAADPRRAASAIVTVINAAASLRHCPATADETWIEEHVLRMCQVFVPSRTCTV